MGVDILLPKRKQTTGDAIDVLLNLNGQIEFTIVYLNYVKWWQIDKIKLITLNLTIHKDFFYGIRLA